MPVFSAIVPTIIVADDDPELRQIMSEVLSEAGFFVALAGSGEEVLDAVRHGTAPCLIVCDMIMPGLDFADLVAALRADERTRTVPVAVMTGSRKRIRPAVDHVLNKPFELATLLELARASRDAKLAPVRRRI
jgi:CheY-like chemotaxis protein